MRPHSMVQCPAHPGRTAVSSCSVCGRAVCDLCIGQIDQVDFCPLHFTEAEEKIRVQSYGLPPLPSPVTVTEMLLGVWAVIGAIAPWLPWKTVQAAASSQAIDLSGWEAGGTSALASVGLLAAGIIIGIMVGLRLIRARLVRREPVVNAARALGATNAALLVIDFFTLREQVGNGLWLSLASAGLCLYLGIRVAAEEHGRQRRFR